MQYVRTARRSVLLALTLLSACAASDPPVPGPDTGQVPAGVIGNFLAGRFAMAEGDPATAANDLLKALAESPGDPDLTLEAFIACLNAGRPETVKLAASCRTARWRNWCWLTWTSRPAVGRMRRRCFHALPRQGMTQLLQPLLVAWAQQGDGRTDTALSTLRPYVENPRFRALFTVQAAMIADLGNRPEVAAGLYRAAESTMTEPNLRVAQILASWQARSGQAAEAQRTLAALLVGAPDLSISMPALIASVTKRPVPRAIDGVAEAYFTFAALLRAQEADDFSLIALRLALDLRPDFTAARLLAADILGEPAPPASSASHVE